MSLSSSRQALLTSLKVEKLLPWNFTSTLFKKDVANLDSPVNINKYFPLQSYVSMFKDYAEALQADDFDSLTTLCEPSFRRKIGQRLELVNQGLGQEGLELKIECNRKNRDETSMFLYNIENFFIVGADQQLDRDRFHQQRQQFTLMENEGFKATYPHLSPTNEVTYIEKEINCTQIINTSDFQQTSKGLLVMRLHFLVTSFLNIYVWDPVKKECVLGNQVSQNRSISDKKCHLMTVDKLVAQMHVGDTFLETEEQINDQVLDQFKRDEAMFISDFDGFMPHGNPFLVREEFNL